MRAAGATGFSTANELLAEPYPGSILGADRSISFELCPSQDQQTPEVMLVKVPDRVEQIPVERHVMRLRAVRTAGEPCADPPRSNLKEAKSGLHGSHTLRAPERQKLRDHRAKPTDRRMSRASGTRQGWRNARTRRTWGHGRDRTVAVQGLPGARRKTEEGKRTFGLTSHFPPPTSHPQHDADPSSSAHLRK